MMIQRFFSVLVLLGAGQAFAQENLINALANNKGTDIQKYYQYIVSKKYTIYLSK